MEVIIYEGKLPVREQLEAMVGDGVQPYQGVDVEIVPCYTPEQLAQRLHEMVLREAERRDRYLPFRTGSGIYLLKLSKVCYFRGSNHRIYAELTNGKVLISSTQRVPASEVLARIAPSFLWATKSLCVNKACIERIEGATVWLKNGKTLPISRTRYSALVKELKERSDGIYVHERP